MIPRRDPNPLAKALSQSDITGKLVQEEVDRTIAELIREHNPIRAAMPRLEQESGENYIVNRRTARPSAGWVADTDSPAAVKSTYAPRTEFPFKTLLAPVQVTRKAQKVGKTYADLLLEELEAATKDIRDKEEIAFIDGDTSSDPNQPDGLNIILAAADYTKSAGTNGAPLTIDLLDELIDDTLGDQTGNNGALIMAQRSKREIEALIRAKQRYVDTIEIAGGFRVTHYDGTPLLWTQHESITRTKGTASNATNIYLVTWSECFAGVLTELVSEDLSKVSSQYDAFDIYEDIAFVVRNPKYCRRLTGIIPPS